MKLYYSKLAPTINLCFEKKNAGYSYIEISEEDECYFLISKFSNLNHNKFYYGGANKNIDGQFFLKEVAKYRSEYFKTTKEEKKKIKKKVLKYKINEVFEEIKKEELNLLDDLKKYYLNLIFK